MRQLLLIAPAALSFTTTLTLRPADANAAVCAAGIYRAGCVGPRGAVVVRLPHYRPYYPRRY